MPAIRHRPWWRRFGAACLAFWFIVITVDPSALHACPMHDGAAVASDEAHTTAHGAHGASHTGHMTHGSNASVGASQVAPHATPQGTQQSDSPSHSGTHACTCLGQCCAASVPMLTTAATIDFAVLRLAPSAPTGRPQHEYVAARADFVLPFSTAPPSIITA